MRASPVALVGFRSIPLHTAPSACDQRARPTRSASSVLPGYFRTRNGAHLCMCYPIALVHTHTTYTLSPLCLSLLVAPFLGVRGGFEEALTSPENSAGFLLAGCARWEACALPDVLGLYFAIISGPFLYLLGVSAKFCLRCTMCFYFPSSPLLAKIGQVCPMPLSRFLPSCCTQPFPR